MITELTELKEASNKIVSIIGFIAYSGLVFYLSVRPISAGAPVITLPGADKILHAGEFALFVILAYRAISYFADSIRTNSSVVTLSLFYASLTEFSQAFISYRTSSWLDWLANLAGILLGLAFVILVRNTRWGRERSE